MDLEGTVSSEISEVRQSKTNTVWLHLHVESKKNNNNKTPSSQYREQTGGCQRWGGGQVGKTGKGSQKVQTFQLQKPWGWNVWQTTIVNNTVLHIWKLLRVDLKSFHHKKKKSINIYVDRHYLIMWSLPNIYKYWIIMLYTWN